MVELDGTAAAGGRGCLSNFLQLRERRERGQGAALVGAFLSPQKILGPVVGAVDSQ